MNGTAQSAKGSPPLTKSHSSEKQCVGRSVGEDSERVGWEHVNNRCIQPTLESLSSSIGKTISAVLTFCFLFFQF